jgi:hypothetical protein
MSHSLASRLAGLLFTLLILGSCQQNKNQNTSDEHDGYDGPGERIELEFEKTKDPATGRVPIDKLFEAIEQTREVKRQVRLARSQALAWTERGPNSDQTGPSNGNTRANGGITSGRIRAVMVDSLDPTRKTVFVGGVDGGLWKTTDITTAPANWVLVDDFLSNLAIADICQDPRPGFQNIMYFATGESYGNFDAVQGVGVFKSVNGGATWSFLPGSSGFINGTRIVCDYLGNVYLGSRQGLHRSSDGGTTWTDITPAGVSNRICDLEISNTAGPGRLHVVSGIFTTLGYRYTDNPESVSSATGWNSAATPFTGSNQRAEIAVMGNTLYAAPCNASYQVSNIWKSTDGGVNWAVTTGNPTGGWANGQGWYSLSVGINPNDPDNAIVGGLDCYETTNGGNNWVKISAWVGSGGQYVHADQHDVQWWDGGDKLLFACDGGVHFSSNGGTTIRDRNEGLRLKQFYSVSIHPATTDYFIGGTQDNGTHQLQTAGLGPSIEVTGGDGGFSAIDQDEPQYQFGTYVYNNYRRSTNGGATWSSVNFSNTGQFINPFDYDDIGNRIYAGHSAGQYLRWNNPQTGNSNTIVPISEFGGGSAVGVHVSPYTANRVYFGTSNGRFVMVDNAEGASPVAQIITPSGGTGYGNCIVTGSSDQHLIAVYSNYNVNNVWVSSNNGASWTAIDGNLPNMPVRWALFHPDSDTKAYIATETGVWETDQINGSSTVWVTSPSFPAVRTDMIQYRSSDRLIAAATHGRGIWTTNVPAPGGFTLSTPAPVVASCPAPSTLATALSATFNGTFTNPITLSASGAPAGTSISFSNNPLTPGSPGTSVVLNNANTLAPGSYTITVTATATGATAQTRDITFTITPGTGPAITAQPADQSICTNGNTSFSITSASATGFQWQVSTDGGSTWNNVSNGGVYGGAASTTLTLTNVPSSFNGYRYRAIASGFCGSTTSNAALLTVNSSANISSHPQDASVCAGAGHVFSVTATGTGIIYQWQLSTDGGSNYNNISDGAVYTGTQTANLNIVNVTAGMNGYRYRVIVTGSGPCAAPATSLPAILSVSSTVSITSQPANQVVCEGSNTSFTVAGSGSGILYQWQVSTDGGVNFINITNGGVYSGATSATLTLTNVPVSLSGYRYRAQLSNSTCPTPGVSNAALLTVNSLPVIVSQPQSQSICAGGNAVFGVTATGTSLTYQWQISTDGGATFSNLSDMGAFSGTTTATLTVSGVTPAIHDNNRFRVIVSGACTPAATSVAAVLTVVSPVVVTTNPQDAEVCSGQDATFTVLASSSETIQYQWQVSTNGGTTWTNITGANAATYTVNGALFVMNNNRYRVLVSNSTCTTPTASAAALLTVRNVPTVNLTASPYTSLLPGQVTTLTATIGGATGGLLSYAWLFNGNPAPLITGNTYLVDVNQAGTYQVAVQEAWPGGLVCSNLSPLVTITATASSRLFIFPSPNDGQFRVSYFNEGGQQTKRLIAIYDSKGAMVYNRSFNVAGSYTILDIDLRAANTGIYYVVVGDASGKKLADGKVHVR